MERVITGDMIHTLMKSNFRSLKSFVELLNGELDEVLDDQDVKKLEESTVRILNTFGAAEADLLKQTNCLKKVEERVNRDMQRPEERLDRKTLSAEIKEIINLVEGKTKKGADEITGEVVVDERRLAQTLQPIREIIEEFHPMRLEHEEAEDDEEEAENHGESRLEEESSQLLKAYQQKAIRKRLEQLSRVDESESQQSQQTQEMEVDTISDEEADDDDNANAAGPSGEETRSAMQRKKEEKNRKLKSLWDHYEKEQLRVSAGTDVDQIYEEVLRNEADIPLEMLPHYSTFKKPIMELFSKEAVVCLQSNQNYICPISKVKIRTPIRNIRCDHLYDKNSVYNILKNKREIACPVIGCSCRAFTANDLEENEELTQEMERDLSRNANRENNSELSNRSATEMIDSGEETEDEDL